MTSKKIHSNLHTFVNKLPVIISKKSVLDFKQITKKHVRFGVKRPINRMVIKKSVIITWDIT